MVIMLWITETFVNVDKNAMFGETPWTETRYERVGDLFKSLRREYGPCQSKMYRDTPEGSKQVGWVFAKRMEYEDAWRMRHLPKEKRTYIREVWIEVSDTPPRQVTSTVHHPW